MDKEYLKTLEFLKKYGQEHLLKHFNDLTENEKEELLKDIESIDFEQIQKLYEQTKIKDKIGNDVIEPISYIDKEKLTTKEKEYYSKIGEDSIKNNEYAVVTMAGGQRNKIRSYWTKRNIWYWAGLT